jgi:hypothetical protein
MREVKQPPGLMRNSQLISCIAMLLAACSRRADTAPPDPALLAKIVADSVVAAHTAAAPILAEKARSVMMQLLKNPATAKFDSLIVTQPAFADGSWPLPAVCGRIGGKPGLKGSSGMTQFIYLNPVTVFVLEGTNAVPFGELRARNCDGPGVKVLLR